MSSKGQTPGRDISGQAPGGARTPLAQQLPLDTPLVIQVFPIYACNFRCNYCIFSVPKADRGFISDKRLMDYDLLTKCVDDMALFPNRLKVLRFVGIGEPLLHPQLVDMVAYANRVGVAHRVELLTNGLLLSPRLSTELVAAGLDRLVVSLQGTSAAKYREVCAKQIDFEQFVNNLSQLFENRGGMHVYLKVMDTALDGSSDRQRFYDIFGPISDTLAVEHTVPIHSGVDYRGLLDGADVRVTQFGKAVLDVSVCPQPFFSMQVNPDGKVVPCYSFEYPAVVGNCYEQSLLEIWRGDAMHRFRLRMLDGRETASGACRDCEIIRYRIFAEDQLDGHTERLKRVFAERLGSVTK